jgi:hypothetical protein
MAYEVKKSVGKSTNGAIDGAIASIVAIAVIGLMKGFMNLSPENETVIVSSVGVIVAGVVVAAKKFIENWLKHRDKPAPATPAKPA